MRVTSHLDKVTEIYAAILIRGLHEAEKVVGECVSRPLEVLEKGSDFDRPCAGQHGRQNDDTDQPDQQE